MKTTGSQYHLSC